MGCCESMCPGEHQPLEKDGAQPTQVTENHHGGVTTADNGGGDGGVAGGGGIPSFSEFSFSDLKAATNNFSSDNIVSEMEFVEREKWSLWRDRRHNMKSMIDRNNRENLSSLLIRISPKMKQPNSGKKRTVEVEERELIEQGNHQKQRCIKLGRTRRKAADNTREGNGRETAKWARDRTEEKQYLTKKKDLEFYKEDVENSFTIVFVQSDVVWLRSGSSSFLGSQQ
ncbi:unnamed protein product [Brassica napus]|uniref:(rape) hypothetical protein n=1 Tax=Brassica napus TaxID=3708 RepID=A0A816YKM9_BRANA|nr:unnamed protein product [Brassica napus]